MPLSPILALVERNNRIHREQAPGPPGGPGEEPAVPVTMVDPFTQPVDLDITSFRDKYWFAVAADTDKDLPVQVIPRMEKRDAVEVSQAGPPDGRRSPQLLLRQARRDTPVDGAGVQSGRQGRSPAEGAPPKKRRPRKAVVQTTE